MTTQEKIQALADVFEKGIEYGKTGVTDKDLSEIMEKLLHEFDCDGCKNKNNDSVCKYCRRNYSDYIDHFEQ